MLDNLQEFCKYAAREADDDDEVNAVNAVDPAYVAKPRLSGLALALPTSSVAGRCPSSAMDAEATNNIFGNAWPGIAVAYC